MIDRALSQGEFAALVGITQQAVSDLQRRGVLKLNVTGQAWLIDYCAHLREEAAGRAGVLADASAALKNSQRAEVDMRVAIKRREFMPVSLISEILAKVGRQTSGILEGLVPAIRLRWPEITAEQLKLIDGEIARARNRMSVVTLADAIDADSDSEAEG